MKVVKAKEMARIERLAYAEGASEEGFMNQAGEGVAEWTQRILTRHHLKPKIILLCGSGNNAGDAYVAGRILRERGVQVQALALAPFEKSSPLCQLQSKRFAEGGGRIEYINAPEAISFGDSELLIDGILGTGFHGEVGGLFREAIEKANASQLPIVAVDIPSGIDGTTGTIGGVAIRACDTLFLGLPKVGCFFKEAWNYVGRIHIYDFGLGERFIAQAEEDYLLIDEAMIQSFLPKIERTRHKYQAGYVVGLGGCKGMPGAPVMASFAALRAGAGIVRLLYPEGMEGELAAAPYEVIRQGYREGDGKTVLQAMERASAVFIGPGMGTSSAAQQMLQQVLPQIIKPCVIDAEALTLLAEQEIPLPQQTIMTPHHGEMKRLLHIKEEIPFLELLERSATFASHKNITLVLKGAPTFIFHPGSKPYLCSRGDPGMATAGSGDVLTGVIAAFLAQCHDPLKAAILGVYIHALAGEFAAEKWTSYCMAATDITAALPLAFKSLIFFQA
jgi:ADP-dependent NAD(P)H-hydrate dehydratase / NAD(P)H-hydrate epimerase